MQSAVRILFWKRTTVALTLVGALMAAHPAQAERTTAAAFLRINPSAEYAALGIQGTALANDSFSSFINPAGLAQLDSSELAASHTQLFFDTTYDFLGFSRPLERSGGTIGVSAIYMKKGNVERRTEDGTAAGSFSSDDMALSLSYGRSFNHRISGGMSLKAVRQRIDSYSAQAAALDIGSQVKLPLKGLNFGLSLNNLGTKLKFDSERESLPMWTSAGLSYEFSGIVIAGDEQFMANGGSKFGLGVMFYPNRILSLRAGYALSGQSREAGQKDHLGNLAGFAAGIGLTFSRYELNYALVPHEQLETSHQFSLLSRF